MAEVLKAHKWKPISGLPVYPWHDWLDGQVWLIQSGADFLCSPDTFVKQVMAECHKRGIPVQYERSNNDIILRGGKHAEPSRTPSDPSQ